MMKTWNTPAGKASTLCLELLREPHIVITGATTKDRDDLKNSLLYTLLYKAPSDAQLVFLDSLVVGFYQYKDLPHTIAYSDDEEKMLNVLMAVNDLMKNRAKKQSRLRRKSCDEPFIYVFVEDYAHLFYGSKKQDIYQLLLHILTNGRSVNVKLVLFSLPIDSLDKLDAPTVFTIGSTGRLRNRHIRTKGMECESQGECTCNFPENGWEIYNIPITSDEEIENRIKFWLNQTSRWDKHKLV